jgi:anthranilate phosphoribosyltransferase
VVDGAAGAYRDIALINAAAALVVAGRAASLKEGVAKGDAAIRSGAARRTLDQLIAVSNA